MELGAEGLSDAELLAIFLRTGVAGKSAVDLARHLLNQFGGLRPLLEADLSAFTSQLGLGPAKFAQLQAVMEMARRHMAESLRRDSALENPAQVRSYLKALLRHEPHEVFGCLFLDSKHRAMTFEILFRGTINAAYVHPRQVVKRAMAHNAASLILVPTTDPPGHHHAQPLGHRPDQAPQGGAAARRRAGAGPRNHRRWRAAVDGGKGLDVGP